MLSTSIDSRFSSKTVSGLLGMKDHTCEHFRRGELTSDLDY